MTARRAWRYDRRDRWRRSVLASPHFGATHKLILAATQARMKPDGKFEVERREVMALANVRHPQRVTEAWSRAVEFGYLTLVTKMAYGRPTRYQATFPDMGCDESCTRDGHRLSPPVVTASPGHYTDPSAEAVTKEKLTPSVVTGNPVTIPTGAAPAVPHTHGASPSHGLDEEQQLSQSNLSALIMLAAERFAWADDVETGTWQIQIQTSCWTSRAASPYAGATTTPAGLRRSPGPADSPTSCRLRQRDVSSCPSMPSGPPCVSCGRSSTPRPPGRLTTPADRKPRDHHRC